MYSVSIRLFGSPEISVKNQVTPKPRSKKTTALLAWLALNHNQDYSRERIAQLFWSDSTPESALASLRMSVSNLRKVLGASEAENSPFVVTRNTLGIHSRNSNCHIDAHELLKAHRSSSQLSKIDDHSLKKAEIQKLEKISSVYADQFLAGYKFSDARDLDNWIATKQTEFQHVANELSVNLGRAYLARKEYLQALRFARRAITVSNLFEPAHQLMLEAFAQNGERSRALAHYQELREQMQAEYGLTPSQQTQELIHKIRVGSYRSDLNNSRQPEKQVTRPSDATVTAISKARNLEVKEIETALKRTGSQIIKLLGGNGGGKAAVLQHLSKRYRQQSQFASVLEVNYTNDSTDLVTELAHQIKDRPHQQQINIFWLAEHIGDTATLLLVNTTSHTLSEAQAELLERLVLLTGNVKVVVAIKTDREFSAKSSSIAFNHGAETSLHKRHIEKTCVELFRDLHTRKVGRQHTNTISRRAIVEFIESVDNNHAAIAMIASRNWKTPLQAITNKLIASKHQHRDALARTITWVWQHLSAREKHTISYLVQFEGAIDMRAALTLAGVYATDIEALVDNGIAFRINQQEVRIPEAIQTTVGKLLASRATYSVFQANFERAYCQYYLNDLIQTKHSCKSESTYLTQAKVLRNWNNYLRSLRLAITHSNWALVFHAFDVICEMYTHRGLYMQAVLQLDTLRELLSAASHDGNEWDASIQEHLQAKVALQLARFHYLVEDYDTALEYSKHAVGASIRLNLIDLRTASSLQHICNQILTAKYDYIDVHLDSLERLAQATDDTELQIKSLYLTGIFAHLNGSTQVAKRVLTRALTLCRATKLPRKDESLIELIEKLRTGQSGQGLIIRPNQLIQFVS